MIRNYFNYRLSKLLSNNKYSKSIFFFLQRSIRGWDDSELYNLDQTLAKFLLPRLKRFRVLNTSHPNNLPKQDWNQLLDLIIRDLQFISSKDYPSDEESMKEIKENLNKFINYFDSLWY